MRWGRGWVVVAVVAGLGGCAGPAGIQHRVERGESLYRIGKAYGVSAEALAKANGIKDASRIEIGQMITVPNARRDLPVRVITPEQARADRPTLPELPSGASPFLWPVDAGVLSSPFGARGDSHHDGVDISTPEGTAVHAARAGRVLYSDQLRGYGNLIIIEHDDGYATVYAHNRDNRARTGATVRQGDVIATVGRSGKTSGPNLHFEIRKDNIARNPLFYLPALPAANRRVDVVDKGA